ncbi:MAG: phosphatase PAP2 family protein [Actinomycetota bacterium]
MILPKILPAFIKRRLDPAQRYGLRLTLFIAAVSLAGIPFAYLLVEITSGARMVRVDRAISEQLFELKAGNRWLSTVFNGISFLGFPPWFWVLVGGVSLYLLKRSERRLMIYLLSSTIGGSIVNTIVKETVNRPRPTFKDPSAVTFQSGKSFPSGHAMSSTIAYGALLLIFLPLIPKRYRKAAIAGTVSLVLVIGLARLGLGVHYLSDVIGGYILGLAWLAASTAAFSIWRIERGAKPVHPLEAGVEPEAAATLHP